MRIRELLSSLFSLGSNGLDLEPREVALFQRSVDAEKRHDYEAAVALMREVLVLCPDSAPAHNRLAVILAIHLKRLPEAIQSVKRALELDPGNIAYANNLRTLTEKMEAETPQ